MYGILVTVAKAAGQIDTGKCGCFTPTGKGGEAMNFPYDMAIWAIVAIVAIIYGNKNSKK